MTNSQNRQHWPYLERPDGQVLDAADQYGTAFFRLIELPPGTGVLLPALHCGALAIELYVKAWCAHQVAIDDGQGLGFLIRAIVPQRGHRPRELLPHTPPDFRDAFARECAASDVLVQYGGVDAVLAGFEDLFVSSRYPYEPEHRITDYPIDALGACVTALRRATQRTRSVIDW